LYVSTNLRGKFDPEDEFCHYPHVELDEENEDELHLHLTSNIYMTFLKDEWEVILEKVNKVTFGKW
jgi:hypothetical protein